MKNDSRSKYSDMRIRQAFMQLLKEQPVEKISVSQICKLAELNRSTFYRYYNDQYDLLSTLGQEVLSQLKQSLMKTPNDLEQISLRLFQSFYEQRDYLILLFGQHGDIRLNAKVSALFTQHFRAEHYLENKQPLYEFISHGIVGLFHYWIDTDFQDSPEAMTVHALSYIQLLTAHEKEFALSQK